MHGFMDRLPGIGIKPNKPVIGIAATSDGKGYWLVSAWCLHIR
jgi:hypothetical protein